MLAGDQIRAPFRLVIGVVEGDCVVVGLVDRLSGMSSSDECIRIQELIYVEFFIFSNTIPHTTINILSIAIA